MGRKPLGWSAIILGLLGVVAFLVMAAATVLLRGTVNEKADEYLDPADRALDRLAFRLTETGAHTETVREGLKELVATGSDRLLESARTELGRLQIDLLAIEASVMSVDSGMDIISALPLFGEERRGFREAIRIELAALREELSGMETRLIEAQVLAAEIRAEGDAAEKARIALKALAAELAPKIAAVRTFLGNLGTALAEVRLRLGDAADRIGRGLTTLTVVLCFMFGWLALAHYCVYLAGKRLLEEQERVEGG